MSRFAYEKGDIGFIRSIEGVIKNGKLVIRKDSFDRRKNEYKVIINGEKEEWYSSNILKALLNPVNNLDDITIKGIKLDSKGNIIPKIEEYQVVKVTKENIQILKRFVDKYLRENRSADEYYDYGYSNCDYFNRMRQENFVSFLKNGFMGLHNGEIETLFVVFRNSLNIPLVHTVFGEYSEDLSQYVSRLSPMIKNSVFYYEYFHNSLSQNSKLKIMSHNSSFDKDRAYMFYHGVYLTEYDIYMLPKIVEKKYFPEIDNLNDIEIKCIRAKELDKYFKNMYDDDYQGYWKSIYNNVAVSGFTYFHTEDFHANYGDIKYLVALYKDRIIGIIKFGIWPNSNHQALSYVDVSVKYRRLGIATRMIKELNKYITSDTVFVLTDESEMGKLCGMNNICKRYITKTKIKTYEECLRDGHYN